MSKITQIQHTLIHAQEEAIDIKDDMIAHYREQVHHLQGQLLNAVLAMKGQSKGMQRMARRIASQRALLDKYKHGLIAAPIPQSPVKSEDLNERIAVPGN